MTTLNTIKAEVINIERSHQYCSPRMAAYELAEKFADVEVIEASTQDSAIIACAECFVEVKWMNRKHSSIIAREAANAEF